jgi:hypothetical protein
MQPAVCFQDIGGEGAPVLGAFDHEKPVVYDGTGDEYDREHGGKRGRKLARDRQIGKSGHPILAGLSIG